MMLDEKSPVTFEKFSTHCAQEFNKPGGPNVDRIVQIAAEHGVHFVQP